MTGGAIVVDTSVVVEYLVELRCTEQATATFRRAVSDPGLELWAPDLVYVECTSALRHLTRRRSITRTQAHDSIDRLLRLPLTIAKSAELVADAFALGDGFTIYDATYVALAERVGAELVTADAKLARLMRSRGRTVSLIAAG